MDAGMAPSKFPAKRLVLVHIAEQFEVDRHVRGRDETADAVLHPAPERPGGRVSLISRAETRTGKQRATHHPRKKSFFAIPEAVSLASRSS